MNYKILSLLAILTLTARSQTFPPDPVADLVLGQTSFTTSVVDQVTRKVFVIDAFRRILRYPSAAALTSGAATEQVFQQSNFSNNIDLGVAVGRRHRKLPGADV